MELGRVQVAAGKKTEAKQTLDKMIAEFPESAVHRRSEADDRGAHVKTFTGEIRRILLLKKRSPGLLSSCLFFRELVRENLVDQLRAEEVRRGDARQRR